MPFEPQHVPSGTVAFLLSDVVGSTRLWAADPDAMATSLRVHDAAIRSTVAEHDGYVFSTAGDSFAVAFARVSSAVTCAQALLARLEAAPWATGPMLSVRLGLHLGEAEERDGDYFGPVVNMAARVMAAAHGGQCLITSRVADGVGVATVDLGEHNLRDIDTPVHLFQLGPATFPALLTATAELVALPSPRTSLVGREESVAYVRRLLGGSRLVTLTGVGGCGKTRLAIEVASREIGSFPEGVWFVDLAAIADGDAIHSAFATATGVAVTDRASSTDELVAYLAPRASLLVVDNCEHLIDDVAELVDQLLGHCPRLRVVATSREALEIDGEHAWKVPSLDMGGGAATDLFIDRALAAGAVLAGDASERELIAEIVGHLDGVPLAIELAAARTRSMGLDELRDRLDDRFRILAGGKRRSRQRQATLEAAVQWSFDLLSAEEQTALCRLSVFQAGFDLTDVGAVIDVADADAIDLVDTLVAKSLVDVTTDGRGRVRHRLLETIRLFGLARLVEAGEAVTARDRHLAHFAGDRVGRSLDVWLDVESLVRIDREYDNFRAAVEWALERDQPDAAAFIAAIISDGAARRGDIGTVMAWMNQGATLTGRDAIFVTSLLANALNAAGEAEVAALLLSEVIAVGRAEPCPDVVYALSCLGIATSILGDDERGDELQADAIRVAEAFDAGNVYAIAALNQLLFFASYGEYERVLSNFALCAARTNSLGVTHFLEAWRAYALLMLGRVDEAREAAEHFSPIPPTTQWAYVNTIVSALVLSETDGPEAASRALATAAKEAVARRPALAVEFLMGFAVLAIRLGERERARRYLDLQAYALGVLSAQLMAELAGDGLRNRETNRTLARAQNERIPAADRYANNLTLAPGWLTEEIIRWT